MIRISMFNMSNSAVRRSKGWCVLLHLHHWTEGEQPTNNMYGTIILCWLPCFHNRGNDLPDRMYTLQVTSVFWVYSSCLDISCSSPWHSFHDFLSSCVLARGRHTLVPEHRSGTSDFFWWFLLFRFHSYASSCTSWPDFLLSHCNVCSTELLNKLHRENWEKFCSKSKAELSRFRTTET